MTVKNLAVVGFDWIIPMKRPPKVPRSCFPLPGLHTRGWLFISKQPLFSRSLAQNRDPWHLMVSEF